MKNIENLLVGGIEKFGLTIPDDAIEKFIIYFEELSRWNAKVNLTSLSKEEDIVVNLFIDSLSASLAFDLGQVQSVLDVGSGGGFPGIPLKIAFPLTKLTLVEPKTKKTAFLQHITGMLTLDDVFIKSQTIQEFVRVESNGYSYDFVMSKAIKPEDIFPAVLSVLHTESRVCMYRSRTIGHEKSYFGMDLDREIPYKLPGGYGERVLSVLRPAIDG